MKKILFISILFATTTVSLKGQVTLRIVIKHLRSNAGNVMLDFRDENNRSIRGFVGKIENHECVITVDRLNPGNYSFRYFHDENRNKKLDNYLIGAPREGYGFSNNTKGKWGPPDFEKTVFELKKDTTVSCFPRYLKL